jgi:hypothetical protein
MVITAWCKPPPAKVPILTNLTSPIEPGQWVRHPGRPDWGVGQVQSAILDRVTVNFPHAGKVVINPQVVGLEIVESAARD